MTLKLNFTLSHIIILLLLLLVIYKYILIGLCVTVREFIFTADQLKEIRKYISQLSWPYCYGKITVHQLRKLIY